jgi:uncharacterized protein
VKPIDRLLPPHLKPDLVAHRIGIVSDTHAPFRLAELPSQLLDALQGVDLLLHAGDVGELWVLDQLSAVAPVVAVRGNDDSVASGEILPYTQIIALAGRRILLWHSHYPNWQEELASRQDDDLVPKLDYIAGFGKGYNAEIVVFGHWHIPLVYTSNGVTLINPGALASGNEITRQLRQTAAVLFLEHSGEFHVAHFDLAHPGQVYDPNVDFNAGFAVAAREYSDSILADDLKGMAFDLRETLSRDDILLLRESLLPLAHQCWRGEIEAITHAQMIDAVTHDPDLPADLKARTLEIFRSAHA